MEQALFNLPIREEGKEHAAVEDVGLRMDKLINFFEEEERWAARKNFGHWAANFWNAWKRVEEDWVRMIKFFLFLNGMDTNEKISKMIKLKWEWRDKLEKD